MDIPQKLLSAQAEEEQKRGEGSATITFQGFPGEEDLGRRVQHPKGHQQGRVYSALWQNLKGFQIFLQQVTAGLKKMNKAVRCSTAAARSMDRHKKRKSNYREQMLRQADNESMSMSNDT